MSLYDLKYIASHKFFHERNVIVLLQIYIIFILGETQQFTIQIKPAKNYPVDLYYLMDLSKSMLDDLEKLTTLGTKIGWYWLPFCY